MNVGVLGLGSIGMRHAYNLLSLGAQVVGFDPDPKRCKLLGQAGGRPVGCREQAVDQSEAVVIATPNAVHLEDLRLTIAANRHVLAEKPLAHHVDGVQSLLDDAETRGLLVFHGFNLRFHPCVVEAKRRLADGWIGRPLWANLHSASYLPDWRPDTDFRSGYAADPFSGGIVFDAIHEIDLALYLLGPGQVSSASAARTGILKIPSDDLADFVVVHENGAHSSFHVDYITRPTIRTTRVVGTDGMLDIDLRARRLVRRAVDDAVLEDQTYPGSFDDDYIAEVKAFLDRISGRNTPGATDLDGIRALELAIAVRKLAGLPQL